MSRDRASVSGAEGEEQLVVARERRAVWSLAIEPEEEVDGQLDWERGVEYGRKLDQRRWIAQAELQTFSRSNHILPRTVYLSYQFDFYRLPDRFTLQMPLSIPTGNEEDELVKAEVRKEVRLSSSGSTPEFGEPIRSAMHTVLDADQMKMSSSPSSLTPTFPNGYPGKSGSWKDSLQIVSPGSMNDGLKTVRREIGRFRKGYRQTSAGWVPTSVSFDEDEAVFAESLEDEVQARPLGSGTKASPKVVYGNSPSTLATMLSDESLEDLTAWNTDPTQDLELDDYDDFKLEEQTLTTLAQQNKLPSIAHRRPNMKEEKTQDEEPNTPKTNPGLPPNLYEMNTSSTTISIGVPAWNTAQPQSTKGKKRHKNKNARSPSPSPDPE
ncbi:hypothetical protein BT69DRAFT_1300428 [Atractiella rhizophila]|nr:hypothetical protein BT69DRAFT_1300428 [Atractiella rhizophila]